MENEKELIDPSKIGDFNLEKGALRENVQMFAWDGIRECSEDCPMYDDCSYPHKGKCAVQMQYVGALYKAILGTYKWLDEAMLFKIGMEVIPLYVHLSKLQITELSLTTPVVESKKGVGIHPVYKEIRETLKTIQMLWKGMDLAFSFAEKSKLKGIMNGVSENTKDKEPDYEKGDPDFHKKLSEKGPSRKGVIR